MFMNNTFHGTMVDDKNLNAMNIKFLTSMECLILYKHTLKILYKSKHFPPRYRRKRELVFLSDVQTKETPTCVFFLYLGGKCFDLYKIFRVRL